ncbi:hypothetical protein LP414_07285 [Polaromonas sp. P1(28)-13]|nr:hypothetical protein LP414_07285 [Polaromonas sp. P1(28)-13]
MKPDLAGQDINDLLIGVLMRLRLMTGRQTMERQRNTFSCKRLAIYSQRTGVQGIEFQST